MQSFLRRIRTELACALSALLGASLPLALQDPASHEKNLDEKPRSLVATEIRIVDPDSNSLQMIITATPDGPSWTMFTPKGKVVASVNTLPAGGMLQLGDCKGGIWLRTHPAPDGTRTLELHGDGETDSEEEDETSMKPGVYLIAGAKEALTSEMVLLTSQDGQCAITTEGVQTR